MINKLTKIATNSGLLAIFLMILALPIGFMGIINYEESPVVLSAQDSKEFEEPAIKSIEDPENNVPKDIEEVIMRMEREYYDIPEEEIENAETVQGELDQKESENQAIQEAPNSEKIEE